jgi:NADH-quinone oxidoreductase subunit M
MNTNLILTYLLLTPFIGSILVLFLKESNAKLIRWFGIAVSIVAFVISLIAYAQFNSKSGEFQLLNQFMWIKSLNISYTVGIDGVSLLLVLLTTFLTPLTLLSTWKSINKKVKMFTFCMLFLETGMLGVFMSLDLFLFYIFWEAMLIPMYFIIGVWGGEQRIYASVKFFIYTMFGSLLMLVAIIWLATNSSSQVGYFTTNFIELSKAAPNIVPGIQAFLFFAFFISFAIKVPLFPLHTWLPDAHVQAPTAGSVILAGVLLKMGTYGILRFCLTLFPQSSVKFAPIISILAVIGIIYGALVAMVQTDMKKLVAYSSVSHLGFVIQMINHGLSTGALFLLVGFLYERTHKRDIAYYGGIAKLVPLYSIALLFASLSSVGLPGLNGFIGEFLILIGSFKSSVLGSWSFTIFAASGVIFAAVYLLWMYERVVFGEVKNPELTGLKDMTSTEILILIPIFVFIIWIGIYPSTFFDITGASVEKILNHINQFHIIY